MQAPPPLTNIAACVFDAYGTLFDLNSAIAGQQRALGDKGEALLRLWRAKQLEYTWLRTLMGRHADFWTVTGEALDYALDTLGMASPALRAALMQAFLDLDTYPEVPGTLARLKAAGFRTAILSNGAPHMLTAATGSAGIARLLDAVLSVEAAGLFKPHPGVYQLAVDKLGIEPGHICFMSSNAWDACGAASFGLRTVWVNRFKHKPEHLPGRPDAEIEDLAALPPLLGIA